MEIFTLSDCSVNPQAVPKHMLNSGYEIPCLGYGTFGSDHVAASRIADCVKTAISLGYRLIDCAPAYENEIEIGSALQEVFSSGTVKREELFVISKLGNNRHKDRDVLAACAETLRDMQLDYIDLYLVHWPFPNWHKPGCDTTERDPDARPFFEEEYLKVWSQMEQLVRFGLVRSIGVSNMTIPKLESVWEGMQIKPAVNEVELHPHLRQDVLISYLKEKNIFPVAHTCLGSPQRPERDRTEQDTNCLDDPVVRQVARNHSIHPTTVCLKWAVQRGTLPVPFSTNPAHILSNLKCCTEDPLTDQEMQALNSIETQCRLIKATVLLWKGAADWRCMWDEEGRIDRTGWVEAGTAEKQGGETL